MDRPGHQFLAGTALALDQYVHVQRRGLGDQGNHLRDRTRPSRDTAAGSHLAQAQQAIDHDAQFLARDVTGQQAHGHRTVILLQPAQSITIAQHHQSGSALQREELPDHVAKSRVAFGVEQENDGVARGQQRQRFRWRFLQIEITVLESPGRCILEQSWTSTQQYHGLPGHHLPSTFPCPQACIRRHSPARADQDVA